MRPLIYIDCEQGSDEWFAARRGIVTGSKADQLITPARGDLSSELTRRKLIAELIDEVVRPDADPSWQGNRHTERGKELEPRALSYYEQFLAKHPVRRTGFIYNPDLGSGISPDLLVGDEGGVEVKCPDGKTHVLWVMGGVLPDEYKPQVHCCLAVGRRKWWDFLSYCEGYEPFVVRTVRNEYTAKLEVYLVKFNAELQQWKAKLIPQED